MESRICMIRHGVTEGNSRRLYYGSTDIPLSCRGIDELTELVKEDIYPRSEHADYYTTGMLRTEQTLFMIYGNVEHGRLESLREIDFGDFEMKSYDDLKDRDDYRAWLETDDSVPPPRGESVKDFNARVREGFEDLKKRNMLNELALRHREENALTIAVCHGGSISAVMAGIWPDRYDDFYRWIPDPGHGYIINIKDGKVDDYEVF